MRLGCTGCLAILIGCLLSASLTFGAVWMATRMGAPPEGAVAKGTVEDAQRAQQKVFRIMAAGRDQGGYGQEIVLTEQEINALLARNLEPSSLPLRDLAVRLPAAGTAEIVGHLPLGVLAREVAPAVAGALPASWAGHPIWLVLRGTPAIEGEGAGRRRVLTLEVREVHVGRQRIPVLALRLLLEPGRLGRLRLPLPARVESVAAERGRILVRIRS